MDYIKYKPIGIIHSPFKELKGVPIQPSAAKGIKGKVEVFPEYVERLKDIEGSSHIILVCHFHLSKKFSLKVIPYMDNKLRGVFATRSPSHPNPIGISVVKLLRVKENILYVENLDIVDGTPLLDIKPYVPEFDITEIQHKGWLNKNIKKLPDTKDNGRFT